MRQQASFTVTATPEPGMLIRILNLFAVRDHVPFRVRSKLLGGSLHVDVDVAELAEAEAELIAQKMRVIIGVMSVRMETMLWANAA